jgi:hypothetical protein
VAAPDSKRPRKAALAVVEMVVFVVMPVPKRDPPRERRGRFSF